VKISWMRASWNFSSSMQSWTSMRYGCRPIVVWTYILNTQYPLPMYFTQVKYLRNCLNPMWAFLFLTDWAYTHAQYQYYLPMWTTGVMQNDTDTTSNMAFWFAKCNLEKLRKPDRLPKTVERNSHTQS
jgi:hypothetical protein